MPAPFVPDPQRWADLESALHTWRRAHPDATWVEIEAELDRHLNALRADLLGEVVIDHPDPAGACPHCGGRLTSRGTRSRTVVTQGAEEVRLTRADQTCPACGAGLSPP